MSKGAQVRPLLPAPWCLTHKSTRLMSQILFIALFLGWKSGKYAGKRLRSARRRWVLTGFLLFRNKKWRKEDSIKRFTATGVNNNSFVLTWFGRQSGFSRSYHAQMYLHVFAFSLFSLLLSLIKGEDIPTMWSRDHFIMLAKKIARCRLHGLAFSSLVLSAKKGYRKDSVHFWALSFR